MRMKSSVAISPFLSLALRRKVEGAFRPSPLGARVNGPGCGIGHIEQDTVPLSEYGLIGLRTPMNHTKRHLRPMRDRNLQGGMFSVMFFLINRHILQNRDILQNFHCVKTLPTP